MPKNVSTNNLYIQHLATKFQVNTNTKIEVELSESIKSRIEKKREYIKALLEAASKKSEVKLDMVIEDLIFQGLESDDYFDTLQSNRSGYELRF